MATAEAEDDLTVLDETSLYRRIHPTHVVQDANRGHERPSSAAFTNTGGANRMSVVHGDRLSAGGHSPESLLADRPGHRLAVFSAGAARSLDQGVVRTPTEAEAAHGDVVGE